MRIAFVPMSTGSGHNMRTYAIARALHRSSIDLYIYLSSLQDTFTPLFQELNACVINMNPEQAIDHSRRSHLQSVLNWETFLEGYIEPHFFNSKRIAKLTHLLAKDLPDVIVSDYDFGAVAAAAALNVPCVLVTERYNFTIVSVDNKSLEIAGFTVNAEELDLVRTVLNRLFTWLTQYCSLVLTDKPYVEALDHGTYGEQLIQSGKMRFVGPMIRPLPQTVDANVERARYGCTKDDFLIVASMGGTSMFDENIHAQQQVYIESFLQVRQALPHARMILITRNPIEGIVPEGIICTPYIAHWLPLLQSTDLILAHPGWITVTELSALSVPAIFVLSSPREYHELEAFQRLHLLGYETFMGTAASVLAQQIIQLHSSDTREKVRQAYLKVAPHAEGANLAAAAIIDVANRKQGLQQEQSRSHSDEL